MKINWKDLFGKKRIAQLEAENKILNDMLNDHSRIISNRRVLNTQKYKASYRINDDCIGTLESRNFIRKELTKKLVEGLYDCDAITFNGQFDEDTLTYEYTATMEVVLE